MPNEETVTIHETAPDGTETTIEVTSAKPDDAVNGDDKTLAEEVYEAIFDDDIDDDDADDTGDPSNTGDVNDEDTTDGLQASDDTDVDDGDSEDAVSDDPANQLTPTPEEISTNSVEFTIDQDMFPQTGDPAPIDTTGSDVADTGYSAAPESATNETDMTDADAAAQQSHLDAAKDAQAAADEFVDQGDYAAAAQARETAENEAYAAGDSSILGSSDSGDLENAAYQQQNADYYRDQQADHIAAGDYEAAKEDAQNVAYATGDADYLAGGADHTGQADKDVANLDWAVWDQKNADSAAQDAEYYVAQGDFDNAERAADNADSYNAAADTYADHADPTSPNYDYDSSSEVASGGSYDAGYDAGYDTAAVDTGFDAGADTTAATSYDPGTDDVA